MPDRVVVLGVGLVDRIVSQLPARGERMSQELASAARAVLSGPRSGRVYHRRSRTWQASRAGEPPAYESGTLAGSWRPVTSPVHATPHGASVAAAARSDVPYVVRFDPALPGYSPGRRPIDPRPFVDAVIRAASPRLNAVMQEPWLR